uniref:Uncharacterized protein n=1 Tax=Aureoumbra lagunensis TaxID=44058 RepID=A0A7S3K676_9STRA|mmetsp:Transcript_7667/g.10669  ORF Transcript_7667/g.10669 Transcript_7667/m.10669 type:complete len:489 (-) Transcript_7667:1592-3058(-)
MSGEGGAVESVPSLEERYEPKASTFVHKSTSDFGKKEEIIEEDAEMDSNNSDGYASDDSFRQKHDQMFQTLIRAVMKKRIQGATAQEKKVSKRQRTAATVAAQFNTQEKTCVDIQKNKPVRRKKMVRTKSRRKSHDLPVVKKEISSSSSTDDQIQEKTSLRRDRAYSLTEESPPDNKLAPMQIKFVTTHDAIIPPSHLKNQNRGSPPSFRWIATALHDDTGKLIKIRKGIEVTLSVSIGGGSRSDPLVCIRPFPGGIYYFRDLTYTTRDSGLWCLHLQARWSNPGKELCHYIDRDIIGQTLIIAVQYRGDKVPQIPIQPTFSTQQTNDISKTARTKKKVPPKQQSIPKAKPKQSRQNTDDSLLVSCTASDLPFVQSSTSPAKLAKSLDKSAAESSCRWFLLQADILTQSQAGSLFLADLLDSNQRFCDLIRQQLDALSDDSDSDLSLEQNDDDHGHYTQAPSKRKKRERSIDDGDESLDNKVRRKMAF